MANSQCHPNIRYHHNITQTNYYYEQDAVHIKALKNVGPFQKQIISEFHVHKIEIK